jgi:inner membrane protein
MNPFTHLLIGWSVAESAPLSRRERALVTFAGVAPDLDGAGILLDLASGRYPGVGAYAAYHHVLAHNLLAGCGLALLAGGLARRRWLTAGLALLAFHLHLLGDLVGSGGPGGSLWSLAYLYPFSSRAFVWQGQWELNAWPNLLATALLLGWIGAVALRRGRTPLELVSRRADASLVGVLRARCS